MSTRLNGHDYLREEISNAGPGTGDRLADLRDFYDFEENLQRLVGGERVSPFADPKLVPRRAFGTCKPLAGIIAFLRQQQAERED